MPATDALGGQFRPKKKKQAITPGSISTVWAANPMYGGVSSVGGGDDAGDVESDDGDGGDVGDSGD